MNRIEDAIAALKRGGIILVADDEDRENEGDFILAAEFATPQAVNLLATEGRGLICATLPVERARELNLKLPVTNGPAPLHGTAFTDSVDYRHGTTTGISAADRSATLKALAAKATKPDDLARPGHIFPILAQPGGVMERRGHTEASVDLCRLAGLSGVGVLCEVMNADGTMARWPDLQKLAARLNMVLITVEQLAAWTAEQKGVSA